MALHGTIREFSSALEDWASYAERMDSYLAANEITNAGKMRAVLLSTWIEETVSVPSEWIGDCVC